MKGGKKAQLPYGCQSYARRKGLLANNRTSLLGPPNHSRIGLWIPILETKYTQQHFRPKCSIRDDAMRGFPVRTSVACCHVQAKATKVALTRADGYSGGPAPSPLGWMVSRAPMTGKRDEAAGDR